MQELGVERNLAPRGMHNVDINTLMDAKFNSMLKKIEEMHISKTKVENTKIIHCIGVME
jgi:hypothetical protein